MTGVAHDQERRSAMNTLLRWLMVLLLVLPALPSRTLAEPASADYEHMMLDNPLALLRIAEEKLAGTPADNADTLLWIWRAATAANQLWFPRQARQYAEQGLATKAAAANPEAAMRLRMELLTARISQGEEAKPIAAIDALIADAAALKESPIQDELRFQRAVILSNNGRLQQALAESQRLFARVPETGNSLRKLHVLPQIAYLYTELGEYQKADGLLTEARRGAENEKLRFFSAVVVQGAAFNALRQGQDDRARELCEQTIATGTALQSEALITWASINAAAVAFRRQDYALADRTLQGAEKFVADQGLNFQRPSILQLRAMIENARGNRDAGLKAVEEAIRVAENMGMDLNVLYMLYTRTELLAAKEDFKAAYHSLVDANQRAATAYTDEKLSALAELQVRFDVEREGYRNKLLEQDNALKTTQLKVQQQRFWWLLGAGGALGVLLVFLMVVLWQNRRQRRELERLATTDPLTLLANRRQLMHLATQEFERARRYQLPLVLAMIDLDHFKQINDRYGHDTGDAVLRAFAVLSQRMLRQTDSIGRFGGEEFLLILPHTTLEAAQGIVERLRSEFSQLVIPGLRGEWQPTLSAGLTLVQAGDVELATVVKRADEAVYAAKGKGRNRVETYTVLAGA